MTNLPQREHHNADGGPLAAAPICSKASPRLTSLNLPKVMLPAENHLGRNRGLDALDVASELSSSRICACPIDLGDSSNIRVVMRAPRLSSRMRMAIIFGCMFSS
jgi:hypothetical protein